MTKEEITEAIYEATGHLPTNIDDAFITHLKEQNYGANVKLWIGTQAQYNALGDDIDVHTLYVITGSDYEDYIIENGKLNNWEWRKYKSGVAECWGRFNISDTAEEISSLYSITGFVNLPEGLFNTANNMVVNVSPYAGCKFGNCFTMSTNSVGIQIISLNTLSSSNVGLHVIGRWK